MFNRLLFINVHTHGSNTNLYMLLHKLLRYNVVALVGFHPFRNHRLIYDELSTMEEESETPFCVGETVKVTDGPFSSFQGTIETVDNERKKLTVSVKIFGRKTPMELSFTQVEKE